ncbi:hypothetical protein NC653_012084 [Populus alba x Populus x berolinensis]|uniref:Uncharacterized protein n=1 Tax=Populus alba x Populus x berolinensis TaxID=444605 RepID=A0AAD6W768_9ROSI|nr:hypothetical protein NC653_012084 [Populus alba x Populus x berolinensis]
MDVSTIKTGEGKGYEEIQSGLSLSTK